MKKIILLLVASLFLSNGKLLSQNVFLGIDSGGAIFNFPSTVYQTDSASFYVWVHNYGPGNFTSDSLNMLNIYTAVDSGAGFKIDSLATLTMSVTITAGSSISVPLTQQFSSGGLFKVGGNVVVIWPASSAANVFTQDSSAHYTVVVLDTSTGFVEIDKNANLNIYPNPVKTHINIPKNKSDENVEKVRIMGVTGQEVKTVANTNIVDVSDLQEGVYFLEATFKNGYKKTFKIIKQNK